MKKILISTTLLLTSLAASAQSPNEAKFDALLSAQNIGATIKELSAKPHYVSSVGSKEVAENILAKFKSYGWDAQMEPIRFFFLILKQGCWK